MRVFIAGATGVYGRNLVPLLQQRGHQVRALARTAEKAAALAAAAVEVVMGDLLDPATQADLAALVRGCDAVLHLATAIPSDPALPGAWDANTALRTTGTRALVDATLAAQVPRYLQQSIVMAYADGGDRWLDESAPLAATPTAAVIAAMEGMVRTVPPEQLAWCIVRGGSFVGPGTAQQSLVARLRAGREIVPGDGSHYISPVHVADMASATLAALEGAPAGSVFNVCDEPVQYGAYVDALARRVGAAAPPRDPARTPPPSCRASSRAIREQLGWLPVHGIYPEVA